MDELSWRHELLPGDLGRVTELHGVLYASEFGFSYEFEAYVAESLGEFGKRYDATRDRLWSVELHGRLVGCVGILGRDEGAAQLRWFLVHPDVRGSGLGRRLLEKALTFCRARGYRCVYLWTVTGLDAAARLYTSTGFRLTEQTPFADLWGVHLAEQRYYLDL
jgi:GNAT superfamily N-acetyltransferase